MLAVLSLATTTTEVLCRLTMLNSLTRVIISILTIGLPLLVAIGWRRIILIGSVIFTIPAVVVIVLLIFTSFSICFIFNIV